MAELASLQEDLVTEVAANLGVEVERVEMARALRKPGDLTAWETLMRARAAQARRSLSSVLTSIAEAPKAVAISPDYAAAHAYLGSALAVLFFWTGGQQLADEEAVAHIDRAIELAPDNASVLADVSYALSMLGLVDGALTWAERAAEINANLSTVQMALGMALMLAGRLDQAEPVPDRALQINPSFEGSLLSKAHLCALSGRWQQGQEFIRRLRRADPSVSLDVYSFRLAIYLSVDMAPWKNRSFDWMEAEAEKVAPFRKLWAETPMEGA